MSAGKSKARPDLNTEIRHLQRTLAVVICLQAAAQEGTDADMGDALAVIVKLLAKSIAGLDQLELALGREAP